jgi:hypothetical protein
LQPYFAFFSQLGIFLLILTLPHFNKEITRTTQIVAVMIILWIFTGLGFVIDFHFGIPLLAWTYLFIAVLAGIQFIFKEKGVVLDYSYTAFIAISCLGIGLILTPTLLLGGGYKNMDCDVDIISYYETFGEELNSIIPVGSQVFWWGSSPVPLVYLPERNIYPAQLNSTAYWRGEFSEEITEGIVRKGYWNSELGQQWVYEADYLIVSKGIREEWLLEVLQDDEFHIVLQKPNPGTCQRELDYWVYHHVP